MAIPWKESKNQLIQKKKTARASAWAVFLCSNRPAFAFLFRGNGSDADTKKPPGVPSAEGLPPRVPAVLFGGEESFEPSTNRALEISAREMIGVEP